MYLGYFPIRGFTDLIFFYYSTTKPLLSHRLFGQGNSAAVNHLAQGWKIGYKTLAAPGLEPTTFSYAIDVTDRSAISAKRSYFWFYLILWEVKVEKLEMYSPVSSNSGKNNLFGGVGVCESSIRNVTYRKSKCIKRRYINLFSGTNRGEDHRPAFANNRRCSLLILGLK